MKVILLIMLILFFSGCISQEDTRIEEDTPMQDETSIMEEIVMETLSITSDAFEDGGTMPSKYTCDGQDISPVMSWQGIPGGTLSIDLIMDDPDAPGRTFVHWVIFNIPGNATGLPEEVPGDNRQEDGSLQGKTDFGRIGYGGPCPPTGKPHRYVFKVYALDARLDMESGSTKSQLLAAMEGHVLSQGEMIGKYGR